MFRVINETTLSACTWTNWTDEELLLEYRRAGIREAFNEIVRRYERDLYNYLYRYLGNATDAEDVFQKAFLAIVKGCDKFDAGKEFRPWLFTVAINTAIDHKRKTKRYAVMSIDRPMGNDSDTCAVADTLAGNEPEPFEDPMDREIAGKVREAVDMLPEQMKQAVRMVYFQGLSRREAAEAVGINYSVLILLLKKAMGKLNFMLRNVG